MGLFDGWFGNETSTQTTTNDIRQLPDYAEATGARGTWWDTLQSWMNMPGFGAIMPNYSDIWDTAKNRISQYFHGSASAPGLDAKVKSDLARRNMSENPASTAAITRLGIDEGTKMKELASEIALDEANRSEKGRTDWLSSLMGLAQQKPSFMNFGSTTTGTSGGGEGWDILGSALGLGAGMWTGQNQLAQLMKMFGGSQGADANIGNVGLSGAMGDSSIPSWMQGYF